MLDFEHCWTAIQRRDRSQDGRFFFGVVTTGVYCRPSCKARMPLRKNVRFYSTAAEAERDGLRACLLCKPLEAPENDPEASRIQLLCRYIEVHSDQPLKLEDLAARAGLSPSHFQRRFKAAVGLTPKQFLEAARMKRVKTGLRSARNVTDAVYDAGFGSSSRLYERADTRLGMTPKQYRGGGKGITITYVTVDSPVGLMMIGATDRGLCFAQFGDTESDLVQALAKEYPKSTLVPMAVPYPEEFRKWVNALTRHLAGGQPRLDLPLDIRATAFQMRVWRYLQSIPYGEVQSYGEVAAGLGQPKAVRAVARACATNKVAIVIPCHRVIRGNGEMSGYRWGVARKRALIDRERAAAR